ncbi:MAG: hypothetical protein V4674_03315 [Patescibacteria group bacterium]
MRTYLVVYILVVALLMALAYIVLSFLFAQFFENRRPVFTRRSLWSMFCVALLSIGISLFSFHIRDRELGNRFLHMLGGGLLSFYVCYRAVRDTNIVLRPFQFFVFSGLVVTALGVANEILEFILQHFIHYLFASSVTDTWLDLSSNTIGIFVGGTLYFLYCAYQRWE